MKKLRNVSLFTVFAALCLWFTCILSAGMLVSAEEAVYVAKIGTKYYETLQEAVKEAEDGDTITIIADHKMVIDDGADVNENGLNNEYTPIINIAGKTVTVDLNGKAIDCEVAISTDITGSNGLIAFFSVEDGGHLVLKDSSIGKTGKIEMTATTKVYSMFMAYEVNSSIVVEGGSYELDKASSSMFYSSPDMSDTDESQGIFVKGGHFTLGNVGTGSNGSPWIFNASGQNTKNISVTGGTFNADIVHQFYTFEVSVPHTRALKKNVDGTWTMVDAICYVNEQAWSSNFYTNLVGYATLEDAFASVTPTQPVRSGKTPGVERITVLGDYHVKENDTLAGLLANFEYSDGDTVKNDITVVFEGDLYIETDFTVPNNATFYVDTAQNGIYVYETLTNEGSIAYGKWPEGSYVLNTEQPVTAQTAVYSVMDIDTESEKVIPNRGQVMNTGSMVGDVLSVYTVDRMTAEQQPTFYPYPNLQNDPVAMVQSATAVTLYDNMESTLEAVKDGDVVVLLADITDGGIEISKDITLDLGGHTYTLNTGVDVENVGTVGLLVSENAEVILNNGTLTAAQAVEVLILNDGELTVNGNTNLTAATDAVALKVSDGATSKVNTSGKVVGKIEVADGNQAKLEVSGGSFTENVERYCVIGCHVVQSGNWYVAAQHTLVATPAAAATCMKNGNTAYWSCEPCGRFFADSNAVVEIEEHAWVTSDANAHVWDEGRITTQPTYNQFGVKTYTCQHNRTHTKTEAVSPIVNVDLDGDGIADINIDTDGDGIADINIDTDGDHEADTDIDTDGDGIPDKNLSLSNKKRFKISFMVDGKLKAIICYRTNHLESITLPKVPEKEGYIGQWEPFEMNSKNFMVHAVYTEIGQ